MSRFYGNVESNIDLFVVRQRQRLRRAYFEFGLNNVFGDVWDFVSVVAVLAGVVNWWNSSDSENRDPDATGSPPVAFSTEVFWWILCHLQSLIVPLLTAEVGFEFLKRAYQEWYLGIPRMEMGPVFQRPNGSYFPLPLGLCMTLSSVFHVLSPFENIFAFVITILGTLGILVIFMLEAIAFGFTSALMGFHAIVWALAKDFVSITAFILGELCDYASGNRIRG